MSGNREFAAGLFQAMIGEASTMSDVTERFLRIAHRTLFENTDLLGYLDEVEAIGSDNDSYDFLAPFFAWNPVIPLQSYRFMEPAQIAYHRLICYALLLGEKNFARIIPTAANEFTGEDLVNQTRLMEIRNVSG